MKRILRINRGVKVFGAKGGADGLLCLHQNRKEVGGDEVEEAFGTFWVSSAVLFYPEAPATIGWNF
jgi:hypothetical protein